MFAFRRGRGVLDGRSPFAVTLPLGRELWGEADVVLGIGTRLFYGFHQWGVDDKLSIIRVDADPEEPDRFRKAAVALVGDAAPILRRLIDALDGHKRASRHDEMVERQATWRKRMAKLAPQIGFLEAIRDELGEDGILVEEVTQMGFAARLLYPVYKPRTFISPGYPGQPRLGLRHRARRAGRTPRHAGGRDLRRRRLHVHRHRDGDRDAPPHPAHRRGVPRRRLRQCAAHPGGALRQPADRLRPHQSGFRALRGKLSAPPPSARATRRNCARRSTVRSSAAISRP